MGEYRLSAMINSSNLGDYLGETGTLFILDLISRSGTRRVLGKIRSIIKISWNKLY